MPFIFLFSSQQPDANIKPPDVCVATFKLKVCLIFVFLLFSPPVAASTPASQLIKAQLPGENADVTLDRCAVVIKPRRFACLRTPVFSLPPLKGIATRKAVIWRPGVNSSLWAVSCNDCCQKYRCIDIFSIPKIKKRYDMTSP